MKQIEQLKAVYRAATVQLPDADPEDLRATNTDLEGKALPLTMYETIYTYCNDVLCKGDVRPIKVTRYGINHAVGATAPSISFIARDGSKALGSARLFYLNKENAQAEIDYHLAATAKASAEKAFAPLAHDLMPALLEAVNLLKGYLAAHDSAANTGQLSKAADCGFDLDLMGSTRALLEKLK